MTDKSNRAFPLKIGDYGYNRGMTQREYYAGQALMGIASLGEYNVSEEVKLACEYADTLIAELEK